MEVYLKYNDRKRRDSLRSLCPSQRINGSADTYVRDGYSISLRASHSPKTGRAAEEVAKVPALQQALFARWLMLNYSDHNVSTHFQPASKLVNVPDGSRSIIDYKNYVIVFALVCNGIIMDLFNNSTYALL